MRNNLSINKDKITLSLFVISDSFVEVFIIYIMSTIVTSIKNSDIDIKVYNHYFKYFFLKNLREKFFSNKLYILFFSFFYIYKILFSIKRCQDKKKLFLTAVHNLNNTMSIRCLSSDLQSRIKIDLVKSYFIRVL